MRTQVHPLLDASHRFLEVALPSQGLVACIDRDSGQQILALKVVADRPNPFQWRIHRHQVKTIGKDEHALLGSRIEEFDCSYQPGLRRKLPQKSRTGFVETKNGYGGYRNRLILN